MVEIVAKEGEVYFIRAICGYEYTPNPYSPIKNKVNIILDNSKIARYAILTMKKESPAY